MPNGAPAAWRNVITSEVVSPGQALSVGDILLSFPVALLMGEGKEDYVQTTCVAPPRRCSREWRGSLVPNGAWAILSSGSGNLC